MPDIYFDSTRKMWSMKENGLVVHKFHQATLKLVETKVSPLGRQRVVDFKRKTPHAFLCVASDKSISDFKPIAEGDYRRFHYSPYKFDYFYEVMTENPFYGAEKITLEIVDKKPVCKAAIYWMNVNCLYNNGELKSFYFWAFGKNAVWNEFISYFHLYIKTPKNNPQKNFSIKTEFGILSIEKGGLFGQE